MPRYAVSCRVESVNLFYFSPPFRFSKLRGRGPGFDRLNSKPSVCRDDLLDLVGPVRVWVQSLSTGYRLPYSDCPEGVDLTDRFPVG